MNFNLIISFLIIFLGVELNAQSLAGPYAPPAGQNGSTAIHKDSSVFVSWASSCILNKSWQDISNTSLGPTTIGTNVSATNKAGLNGIVSLGDGGSAILTFEGEITNGPGADFAIFENSFSDDFLELAFVEVSSDGTNFYRFNAVSLTDTSVQVGSFGLTDATNIYNLAGKYRAQYGTPFDLNELYGIPGLDINAITHVKIIDVIGSINSLYANYDSQNRAINDPWPTPFASGGFDLEAVGVINFTPTSINEISNNINIAIYPTPSSDIVYFNTKDSGRFSYHLTNINGEIILKGELKSQLNISHLKSGIYFIHISSNDRYLVKKIIKK